MLDLGPGAGEQGGQVMYFGPTSRVNGSLTGQYLRGKKAIPVPAERRTPRKSKQLTILKAAENNLRNIDVSIPLGLFVCLTGVSGSGKSTLAEEILYKAVKRAKGDPVGRPGKHGGLRGLTRIQDAVLVDQRPIGRTPRANLLTYTKALAPIRKLLADTGAAKTRRLQPRHFSFNVAGGRCETCKGAGFEKVEMQFLSDVFITCPECKGKRFIKKVLEVTYQGKNIHDILTMTLEQALVFFNDQPAVLRALDPLREVGLGYIRLGQPINTLSGGEAQRLKLSQHLKLDREGARLFIFDEPTTGLHFDDIQKLLQALQRMVAGGHTVLIIEHNMDVIKTADWIIDLGPEGGNDGGLVVAVGSPEEVAKRHASYTGAFLKKYLASPERIQGSARVSRPVSGVRTKQRDAIAVRGAREHNLKDLSLTIPRQQLVVVTGVSGSGKSTLIFDILFAEGQRRYLESLAPYVRQYVKILERPDVDAVSGIPPTVAIQQRISHSSRRSTVATLTEVYHFLRLLYSKLGAQHCPGCSRRLKTQTPGEILSQIQKTFKRRKGKILAPKIYGRKGFHKDILGRAFKMGFGEARIDGIFTPLEEGMALSRYHDHTIELVAGTLPAKDLQDTVALALKEGNGSLVVVDTKGSEEVFSRRGVCPACGIGLQELDPRLFSFNSKQGACPRCDGLGMIEDHRRKKDTLCPRCGGSRLNDHALSVKIQGHSIWDLVQKPSAELRRVIRGFRISRKEAPIARPILSEIMARLSFMERLGLSYLALSRSGDTLSGGEAQRIRLAAQLGSNLTGVCYILDEPTIGLHARDNGLLLKALHTLKDRGNSILVVEHDEETIRKADHIIDLGPGAGEDGGNVVATGTLSELKENPASVTGASFNGHPHELTSRLRPYKRRPKLTIRGAGEHNLNGIHARFPLGTLICVTGVSGSGKSTLVKETLFRGVRNRLLNLSEPTGACRSLDGWDALNRVLEVDHSPIGRTPRSVPSSYVGFLSDIRKLLSMTPQARSRGYKPGRFSFNVRGGRCEACKGHGSLKVEMSFLPNVYVHCEVCNGRRFNQETLDITYKGKNISEILELTFDEAEAFFSAVPSIRRGIRAVSSIGLGYLRLGQPSPTLSGGEAQRVKLAEELAKPSRGRTLYVMDEPTTGLHIDDVRRLTAVLQKLVEQGNTVTVIEHNMEIIKEADYIIDLGPGGGDEGGRIVVAGSPRELLARPKGSHTARYLKKYLAP
jgi:excinuclease ABC subunit A